MSGFAHLYIFEIHNVVSTSVSTAVVPHSSDTCLRDFVCIFVLVSEKRSSLPKNIYSDYINECILQTIKKAQRLTECGVLY